MKSHTSPAGLYIAVWAALLVLLLLTWGLAFVNLGRFNTLAALGIALVKMTLVIYFFMHVGSSSKLTRLFVAAGFIWFAIMAELTMSDYLTRRGWSLPQPAEMARNWPMADDSHGLEPAKEVSPLSSNGLSGQILGRRKN